MREMEFDLWFGEKEYPRKFICTTCFRLTDIGEKSIYEEREVCSRCNDKYLRLGEKNNDNV